MATRALNAAKTHSLEENMENTVNEQVNETGAENKNTKTFTQDEVNAIVAERLKRESGKYSDYEQLKAKASKFDEIEEASKTELQKARDKADKLQKQLETLTKANEVRDIREKVAKDTGVPVALLTGDTEELCKAQAEGIIAFAKPAGYPTVKDGGEIHNIQRKNAADQFADWFNASLH